MKTIGHHTVEDKGNPDFVEKNAPFLSSGRTAFLGPGYYFWEKDIDLAHWWGRVHYNNKYMICESVIECGDDIYLDLVGDKDDLRKMNNLKQVLDQQIKRTLKVNEVTLEKLIEYCRNLDQHSDVGSFPYKVIRSVDVSPIMREKTRTSIIKYTQQKSNFTDLDPRIILCVSEKRDMLPEGIKIIHPKKYLL
jgi:hypothetical protein